MIYIIGNRISGKGKGEEVIARAKDILTARGEEFKTFVSEYPGHSSELAKAACAQEDCRLIIAIGGDGTFSEVLTGMSLDVPAAFIPAGTGNDFVNGAGLPTDAEQVIDHALRGDMHRYDMISVNGRRCLNIAGTGFDVNVLLTENKIRRVIRGKISYKLALLVSLLAVKFTRVRLSIDGGAERELSVLLIAAANGKYYGGGMPISPDAECDDGYMDLVVIKKLPRILIPYVFVKFFQGKLKELTRYVEVHRCKRLEFFTLKGLPVNVDGELADMQQPICAEIAESAITAVSAVKESMVI